MTTIRPVGTKELEEIDVEIKSEILTNDGVDETTVVSVVVKEIVGDVGDVPTTDRIDLKTDQNEATTRCQCY